MHLDHPAWDIHLDTKKGILEFREKEAAAASIETARIHFWVSDARGEDFMLPDQPWRVRETRVLQDVDAAGRAVKTWILTFEPNEAGLTAELHFRGGPQQALFACKGAITHGGGRRVRVGKLNLLAAEGLHLGEGSKPQDWRCFVNGWQSWGAAGAYGLDQRQPATWLDWLEGPLWYNASTPRPRQAGRFASDFFSMAADCKTGLGVVSGFLSQREQFGVVEVDLRGKQPSLRVWADGDGVWLGEGQRLETDWAVIGPVNVHDPDCLGDYFDAAGAENGVRLREQMPAGWCSWYHFFDQVTEDQIRGNLRAIVQMERELPLELVQIDDGFQAVVGDWLQFRSTFPQGVAGLAEEIRAAGKMPGLWLAPFIVHPRSQTAREHPDWLVKGRWGLPASAGYNWGAITAGLDLTHPAALDYAYTVIETAAHRWGYPYLKLDFLYAGAIRGRRKDDSLTRAQVLRRGMEALRRAAGPETLLLGCGAPLGSALGLVDAMRIGADTAPTWTPRFAGWKRPFEQITPMPAARNAIQNILTRAGMHRRWWWNDPDCLLIRPDSELTLDEVRTFATLAALTGGLLLLSDDLPAVPEERRQIAAALLPAIGQRALVLDGLEKTTPETLRLDLQGAAGEWQLIAWYNSADTARHFQLDGAQFQLAAQDAWVREFWSGRAHFLPAGSTWDFGEVAPHGIFAAAVRRAEPGRVQYLGGDLHLSQGLEVRRWLESADGVEMTVDVGRQAAGKVVCAVPPGVWAVWVGAEQAAVQPERGCLEIPAGGMGPVEIRLRRTES